MRFTFAVTVASSLLGVAPTAMAQDLKSNRYVCYRVTAEKGATLIKDFKIRDQFGPGAISLGKPELVCNPVDRDGKAPADPKLHLVCYRPRGTKASKPVEVSNEFGV